jgi:glycosyltransferase A (GT-A) superfamily protein (DUF2064 family)
LAVSLSEPAAAHLAAAMLSDVWSVLQNVAGIICILAAAESGSFGIDVPTDRIWLQQPGDLGSRIECILRQGLQFGPAAIALSADSPLLRAQHIHDAIDCLKESDAVLGPAADGGFYLLGVRDCPPGLLADVPWSSSETYRETIRRFQMRGMRVATIGALLDVDTFTQLETLRSQLQCLPLEIAPHTRKWFDETSWSASSFQP